MSAGDHYTTMDTADEAHQSTDESSRGLFPVQSSPLLEGNLNTPLSTRLRSQSFVRGDQQIFQGKKKLGVLAVCLVAYFNISGGPIGSEEIISSAGPLPGLVGLLVFALFWGLPMALVTCELSTAFPDDGGYSIWVAEAFGELWGFQECYWSWVSGVVDTAVYPVLAFETVRQLVGGHFVDPVEQDPDGSSEFFISYGLKLGMVILFTIPNLFCLNTFGSGLSVFAVFVLLPFVVLAVTGMATNPVDVSQLLEVDVNATVTDWKNLVSVLYWNFSGFDSVSTCAGEVANGGRTYPRALLLTLLMVFLTYFVFLASATVVNTPKWQDWEEGWFSKIANDQVGAWMAGWILLSSLASNMGMYIAEVFEDSWQLFGMAEARLVPGVFAYRHPRFNTPWISILAGTTIIAVLVAFDFQTILNITNFFSVISCLLELAAFLKLRIIRPELERPFKVPCDSTGTLILWLLFPVCMALLVVVGSFDSWFSLLAICVSLGVGFLVFFGMKSMGHIRWGDEATMHLTLS